MRPKRTFEDYDFYNKDRKFEFIKEKGNRAVVIENVYGWFEQAAFFEKKYDRDLCEWTGSEIVTFMKFLSTPRISVLANMLSSFRTYTDWCLQNGMVADHQNHYDEIKPIPFVADSLNYHELDQLVLTREQLMENIRTLPNTCDKFIFLGFFEGLTTAQIANTSIDIYQSGETEDILNFGKGKDLKISKQLGDLIKRAYEDDEYISLKTDRGIPLVNGTHIIRPLDKERTITDPVALVYKRYNACVKWLGLKYSQSDITTSGLLEYIVNLAKENQISIDDFQDRYDLLSQCTARYGTMPSWKMFFYVYGRYFHQLYDI